LAGRIVRELRVDVDDAAQVGEALAELARADGVVVARRRAAEDGQEDATRRGPEQREPERECDESHVRNTAPHSGTSKRTSSPNSPTRTGVAPARAQASRNLRGRSLASGTTTRSGRSLRRNPTTGSSVQRSSQSGEICQPSG